MATTSTREAHPRLLAARCIEGHRAERPGLGETRYAAKSWKRKRRVIMKAEVVRLAGRARATTRFVVTTWPSRGACTRSTGNGRHGEPAQELHYGLGFDRTSCSASGPTLRVLLTAAAYVLLQPCAPDSPPRRPRATGEHASRAALQARRARPGLRPPDRAPSAQRLPWLALWQAVALALGRVRASPARSPPPLMFGRIRVTHAPLFAPEARLPPSSCSSPLGATLEIQLSMDALLTVSNAIARSFTNSAG